MERCGFFDANLIGEEYDRVYLAAQFAAYFSSFIGNGVFGGKSNELQVVTMTTPQMQVSVRGGQGYINGYWYENTDALFLPLQIADGVLNRIDSVVLRWGSSERNMWLAVKTGTPALNPVAPPVARSADFYELQLATLTIPAGTVSITQAMITDTRLDTSVCGFVVGLVKQFDTTAFGIQLQTFINDYIARANADYLPYLDTLENLKELANIAYQEFLLYLAQLRQRGSDALEDFLTWLLNQRPPATNALSEFLLFIGNLRDLSTAEVEVLLEQLRDLIDTEVASQLDARIRELEGLRPTEEIANIEHGLDKYMKVNLYEFDYGAGVQGAGVGPAGGGPLTSVNCEYTLDGFNKIVVKTQKGFGTVESVGKINDRAYVVFFAGTLTSVLIMLSD